MMKFVLRVSLTLLFFSVLSAHAAPYIIYDGSFHLTGGSLEVKKDASARLTIQDILHATDFQPSDRNVPDLKISADAYWVRCFIINKSRYSRLALQITNPIIDEVNFYLFSHGILTDSARTGDRLPFRDRAVHHQTFIQLLDVAPGDTAVCYIRLRSGEQLMLPMYVGTQEQVFENALNKDVLFGIYAGIILVMIFYNLFIFYTVRDRNYVYYVVYLLVVLLTQASLEGYFFRFILPNAPQVANKLIYIFSALIGLSAIEFSKLFLNSREIVPKLHKLSYVFWVTYGATIVLALVNQFNASYGIILVCAMLSAVYVITTAIVIRTRGSRSAKYFLIAWSAFIVGVIVYVLKDFGIVPYSLFSATALQWGSALEAIMLSFALADKINVLREQALTAEQENLRLVREQNVILETKVAERTIELNAANKDLNTALTDLKGTQSQLVESEKMASLGQLTAGIAHEINNPINFVIANVRPLRRDIDLLKNTLAQIETLALEPDGGIKVKEKITAIKEEVEYDYLTDEIEFLLKGISEGSERTAEIVKGLRIFARVDEDDLKKANIHEGIDSTTVIVNTLLNNRIIIEKHYAELPYVECYPGKLNQVFLNIITNGIHAITKKFGDKSGGRITITTSRDEQFATVRIKDNGIGISKDVMGKIFDPFFTTKEVGEGTGLGLSIAYNIIKKHNGRISVDSEAGTGTEFTIEIPILQY